MASIYGEVYGDIYGEVYGAEAVVVDPTTEVSSLDERIQTLEDLLDSGAVSVVQDGQSVTFDRVGARKRLRELKAEKAAQDGAAVRRPAIFSVNLNF